MVRESGDSTVIVHPLFQEEGDGLIPISPLQLRISEIDMRRAQDLNETWHSVLPKTHLGNLVGHPASVAYAATFANRYYAVAIWSSPIAANRLADGWSALELRRFAIAAEAPKNTASRMLRVMRLLIRRRWPDIKKLISYQAQAHHAGTIYKAAGWMAASKSPSRPWHVGDQRDLRQTESATIRWECAV